MLRPLLLVAALSSAAAQCAATFSLEPHICRSDLTTGKDEDALDSTLLTPPAWKCDTIALNVGEVVPIALVLVNGAKLGVDPVAGKFMAPETYTVYYACGDDDCYTLERGAGNQEWFNNVLTLDANNPYTPVDGITTEFTEVSPGKATVRLTGADIELGPGENKVIGTIWTRATSNAEVIAAGKPYFQLYGEGATTSGVTNDPVKCPLPTFQQPKGSTSGAFLASPPPPPPPPDCCSEANLKCLARCDTCVGDTPSAFDALGFACSIHCDASCQLYPSTQSKKCFTRCSQCVKGSEFDAEGGKCSDGSCADCASYDKCMRAGVCTVGCVSGRRKRKLLFAPIPVCEPCCMQPVVVA